MGIETGLIQDLNMEQIDELLFRIQPAFLQSAFGQELSPAQRDEKRAEWVRERLTVKGDE